MMNEYELQREERVRQNNERMRSLITASLLPSRAKNKQQSRKKQKDKPVQSVRASQRLAANPPPCLREEKIALPAVFSGPRSGDGEPGERGEYRVAGATSCHACRQCTTAYKAECTSCTVLWCKPCLRIKMGQKAEDVNAGGAWRCPRCRGACPCSACRRKAGKLPLGVQAHAAREAGFASVREYRASLNQKN